MMTKFSLEEMKCSKTLFSNLSRINQNEKNEKKPDSQQVYVFQQRIKFFNFVVVLSRLDIVFAIAKICSIFNKFEF